MSERELIKYKISELKVQLPLLCDEDYYNCCNEIQQLEIELERLGDN